MMSVHIIADFGVVSLQALRKHAAWKKKKYNNMVFEFLVSSHRFTESANFAYKNSDDFVRITLEIHVAIIF